MYRERLFLDFSHGDNQIICGRESASASAWRGEEFLRLRRGLETDARGFVLVFTLKVVELSVLQARNS